MGNSLEVAPPVLRGRFPALFTPLPAPPISRETEIYVLQRRAEAERPAQPSPAQPSPAQPSPAGKHINTTLAGPHSSTPAGSGHQPCGPSTPKAQGAQGPLGPDPLRPDPPRPDPLGGAAV